MNTPREAPGRVSGRAPAPDQDLLAALSLDDKVRLLTGADNWRTCPHPGIGLRPMVMSDGPAGVRGVTMDERNPAASLPCPSALGATWDPDLVQVLAAALGAEARSKGVDILLAPVINVMRTPLGGRGFESFGEDPVLIARMAVAFVSGLRQAGVAAAVKHYVGNDSETGRWTYDARIAEHVLRELYLAPFEACVREADVDLVMTGYNMVNGLTMTEHGSLLGRILKEEWGFGGVALSDWHAARSTVATAVAGLDLAMPGPSGPWGGQLAAAVRAGMVGEDAVDDKVRRILRLASRVGALGGPPDGSAQDGQAQDGQAQDGQALDGQSRDGQALDGRSRDGRVPGAPVLADPALLRRGAAAAFTLLRNDSVPPHARPALPLEPGTFGSLALIGPNALSPVTQGGGSATVPQVSVSTPAGALIKALAGQARVIVRPGCATWSIVPEPPPYTLRDPDTGEPGVRLEFRTGDGALAAAEHRGAAMFTWWDGLPGIGPAHRGRIVLRTSYLAVQNGPHVIGAGGVGRLTLTVNGTEVASGHPGLPADPVEAMVRPGEIRAAVDLAAGHEAEIEICLRPDDWPQGPVAIRLGVAPAPDDDAMIADAVEAARAADAAVVVVGSAPGTESEGFDRTGLALPGRQDELVRRVAAVNGRTIVVVNAGMPVLMPWADQVAAVGYAWLPGQVMGAALADVLLGQAEPGGRLPVTMPAAEADCPVLHAVPQDGRLEYREGLLTGYRGFDRAGTEPHYAFGHGLGYTTWAYESAAADSTALPADGGLGMTVTLRNTGRRTGREVVQAYVEPPAADPGRPLRTLAAFTAVTATPGEQVRARLTVPARAFARYDEAAGGWVRPAGAFTVRIGRSSADLPLRLRVSSLFLPNGAARESRSCRTALGRLAVLLPEPGQDQGARALARLRFPARLAAPGSRVDRAGNAHVAVRPDHVPRLELVDVEADAVHGQVLQVRRDRDRRVLPAVAVRRRGARARRGLVVRPLPVDHGRGARGHQVAEAGVPAGRVVRSGRVVHGVHHPADLQQGALADHPGERGGEIRPLDPEQVLRAEGAPDVLSQLGHAEGIGHVAEDAAVVPQLPHLGRRHAGRVRPRLVEQVEDHLGVVAVHRGEVLPEDLGGRRRPLLRAADRRGPELGVVVEDHDQVMLLGRGDLGLDGRQVGPVQAGPVGRDEVVLV